ncbi:hypothetical protein [Lentzea sp. E54]|uniref:hypothetical protein n=1 Tax=Lentzea xerophila TaxID=3435883 RepID=UPI003DA57932
MTRLGIGGAEGPQTEFEAAAQSYQDDHRWTVGVYGSGVWLVVGREVEALDMPKELGIRAWNLLDRSVPVFEASDDHGVRWTFVTTPHTGPTLPELAVRGVDHIRSGRSVDLPPSRFGRHELRWITGPFAAPIPSFAAVADAVLRAAQG